ncbi:unnamed protein product [Allacma fusca]|uniref:O-acyltransferase WSD1 C-terminal domain-containing protein n=1 Tax=Allacma fusca TaxID=39272 RepID=A0A8J2PKL5_9HEXA|nr:unnamed protein product [Allacma fusca]
MPAILLIVVVNECVRAAVSMLIYFQFKGKYQLVENGEDNVWGYQSPGGGNCRNVLFIAVYENQIDGYRYRSKFSEEVINFVAPDGSRPYLKLKKIFTRAKGYYCWKEDETFDISRHVIILPEDEVVTETDLFHLLEEKYSKDMDETMPQWQEIIIPRFQYDQYKGVLNGGNKNGKLQSARILRFHHSYGDAGSWLLLYSFCMAGGKIPYAVNPLKGYPVPAGLKFLYFVNAIIFSTTSALKATWNGRHMNNRLVTPQYSGEKFYAWSEALDLNILKEIKVKTKTSISIILASIVAGALRAYGQKYPHPEKKESFGDESYIGAVAAVLPYPNYNLRNRFTIFNFPVPTGDMTSSSRLKLTYNKGVEFAQSPEPIVNYLMFNFFGRLPIAIHNYVMRSCGTPIIFSNLPGASETFSLWDDAVAEGGAWVPLLTTAGLSIAAAGYKNNLRFCGVTDSACMRKSELNFILYAIQAEIEQLAEETVGSV